MLVIFFSFLSAHISAAASSLGLLVAFYGLWPNQSFVITFRDRPSNLSYQSLNDDDDDEEDDDEDDDKMQIRFQPSNRMLLWVLLNSH